MISRLKARAVKILTRTGKGRASVLALVAVLVAGFAASIAGGAPEPADRDFQLGRAASSCDATVLEALRRVGEHIYQQGVSGERAEIALRVVARSRALRKAVEHGDAVGARVAAQTLLASGHMTSLTVQRGTRTLAAAGAQGALAPLHGSILSSAGVPIGRFVASVTTEAGFVSELRGYTETEVALRAGSASIGNSPALGAEELPPSGTLVREGVSYQYDSFPAALYPAGALRVYLLRPVSSIEPLCGATPEDSIVNALSRVASVIYANEGGLPAVSQVHRAQQSSALLDAVAAHDPVATRLAVAGLVYGHTHIVRMRVSAGGRVLADIGGPDVLAPISAPLSLGGKPIGELVLSIQDDEGYLRLAKRLAGLDVLMYTGSAPSTLVKNSVGPNPGAVPASGLYDYRGRSFRVFTLEASSFPSGQLRILVLIPIPYS